MNYTDESSEDIHSKGGSSSDGSEEHSVACTEEEDESGKELHAADRKKTYRCASCGRAVEDVLIFSCKHLICLICASEQLQKKYEKCMKACSEEGEKTKRWGNHKISECFLNSKGVASAIDNDKLSELFKKEKLGYITCYICNVKNKLSLDTIELLTKVGLFSHDVLNVHKFFFNSNTSREYANGKISEDHIKKKSVQFNDTLNSDVVKNEDLKKLLVSSSMYRYLEDHTDDMGKYSYICNVCSLNEAVMYCNDCVEYLCKECCNSIHQEDIINKVNFTDKKCHDYYEINKKGIHLKKIVKSPKKFLNIRKEDIEILHDRDGDSSPDKFVDENLRERKFGDNYTKEIYKVYDDDNSDFDNYDENHFYERKKKLIDREDTKKKRMHISKKLNDLVEDMKNASSYDSENSSAKGTTGSVGRTGGEIKGETGSRKYHEKGKRRKNRDKHHAKYRHTPHTTAKNACNAIPCRKKDQKGEDEGEEGICLLSNSTVSHVDLSSSESSMCSVNNSEREISIRDIRKGGHKIDSNVILNDESVNSKNFTTIENIRCSQHYNYPIQYFCHTCCNKCFCSECAINGVHTSECNIENINKAFITVLNNYLIKWNEIINELMNDLNRNFYESLEDIKNDWSLTLSECYYDLNSKIGYITNNLSKKEKEIFEQLDLYMDTFKRENMDYIELLNSKYDEIEKTINIIRDNKFQNNPIEMIKFYRNNINMIDRTILANNDFKPIEDLSKIRQSKIFYMDLYASQIVSYMRYLQAFLKPSGPYLPSA
ncbi:tripartite motif protein, putative [Plasmodium knowlesi strain H]|uniref:Tripartite motif protein, putative n=3 Tax=Plasmodium knowlesi TaxID=5850 RepID=A0A5E7X723_PLAKH|nr:tripartite motif protein, putative [Plasmodium knowlesi strain H]OTN64265.1 putative Tripartite motif protein [Plasmodium knowlesi]CAA9990682.1 tripartite motif protein, putative [Plasmodium knowlesi strain H]SBO25930.1 tripartite motif protein, putative [Plasmodium knowlesi strain H]SBO28676.1 tripartite motif protein, putative [Plasmodium knowlesi strain H]VVS80156.1 tripartite motif protein, putative [Plasmodium knowlesi strain H]